LNTVELLLQTQKETDDDRIRYQPADHLSVWRVAALAAARALTPEQQRDLCAALFQTRAGL
jgi:hypothetical protein